MSNVAVVGLDLGKSTFHLVGLDAKGKRVFAKKLSRKQLFVFTANLPSCLIGMETCCGAHAVARKLISQGHDARLIPGQYVTPYVKTMKNDFIDAEAIAEAAQRAHMRFVPVKTEEQLDLQALHRVRERLIGRRTCLINQVRGFLLDRGFAVSNGRSALEKRVPLILEEAENTLTPRMRQLLFDLRLEWREIDVRLSQITAEIEQIARQQDSCQRLTTIPGIGPMISTAIVSAIGNGAMFRRGRDFSAWVGLVPRQRSTGGRTKLLVITKHGNSYIRKLLIQGARSIMSNTHRGLHSFGGWLTRLQARADNNIAAVAMANKLARIAWAVLAKGEQYRAAADPVAA
jgi:transposase